MQEKDYISQIATIHNLLTEISVKGEDVIRMANILQICRNTVQKLSADLNKDSTENSGD